MVLDTNRRGQIMRILVIDDTPINLMAAEQTLADHDLTLAATYNEAYNLLGERCASSDEVGAELKRRGIVHDDNPKLWYAERERIEVELQPPPPFDVVLCDLLMPVGHHQQGPEGQSYVELETPVGFALALMAVLQGAKYVAVVTNLNHHEHPAAEMLDRLGSSRLDDDRKDGFVKIRANGVPVGFVNNAPMTGVEGTTCHDCGGTGFRDYELWGHQKCDTCEGDGKFQGKDWGRVLEVLLEN